MYDCVLILSKKKKRFCINWFWPENKIDR